MAKKKTVNKPAVKKEAPGKRKRFSGKTGTPVVNTIERVKLPTSQKEISSEGMYEQFRNAVISTDRLQPSKKALIYVDIENEQGETEAHLLDMRQVPQDIVDSWDGEII